jgi:endonuclease YncB( thermonuclease family)
MAARLRLLIFATAIGLVSHPAKAEPKCDLPPGETATVASAVDGETLTLTDGREVRLLGIKAPAPPLGWKGEDPWPFVAEAKDALDRMTSGATVVLHLDARREDRYGHVLAHVFLTKDGKPLWLQEALVAQGFARVASLPDARACVGALLEAEREARAARRGLWRSWAYRVEDAGDPTRLGRLTRTYQLVEGTVHAVGEGRKLLYVNFAEDWRRDFTIVIERKNLAAFEAEGLDLARLAGTRVRVRGWVEWWNGPMIAASHPEQIEILTPAAGH